MTFLIQSIVLVAVLLLAWGLSFCTKSLRLGRPLGYFLAGVIGVYCFNYFSVKTFETIFLQNEIFVFGVEIFAFAYLTMQFFNLTQYLRLESLKNTGLYSLLILLSFVLFIYLVLILSKISFMTALFSFCLLLNPYLINNRKFKINNNSFAILNQSIILFVTCFTFISCGYFMSTSKSDLSYCITKSLLLSLGFIGATYILNSIRLFKHFSQDKKLSEILEGDVLPCKRYFYLIFTIFLIIIGIIFADERIASIQYGRFFSLFSFLIISGFVVANLFNIQIYNSLKLINRFYIGEVVMFLYLAFNFCTVPSLNIEAVSAVLGFWLSTNFIIYFVLRLSSNKQDIPFSTLFALAPVTLVCWLFKGTFFAPLAMVEIIGTVLFNLFLRNFKPHITQVKKREDDLVLNIADLFGNRVVSDMQVRNNKDALKMLLCEFVKEGYFADIKELIPMVMGREEKGSTALGERVAIPHFHVKNLATSLVAFGILKHGENLDWDAPDGLGVRYIFLIISPEDNTDLHIKTLQKVTQFAMNSKNMDNLAKAARQGKIQDFYQKFEAK